MSGWKIQQHHIRMLLHSFDDNFPAIRGDIEVANVEAGSEPGQLALGTGLQVDEPNVLVLNLSSQKHERLSSGQEDQVSSPPRQGKGRQGMHCGLGR